MECWPGSKVLILKYHDLMSMYEYKYLLAYLLPIGSKNEKYSRTYYHDKSVEYPTLVPRHSIHSCFPRTRARELTAGP